MALYDSPGDEEREKALESGSAEKTGLPPRSHTRPYSSKLDHGIQTGWSSPPPGDFKPPQRTNTGSFSIDSMFKQFPETDFSRFTEWVERLAIRIIYPEMFVVGIFLVSIYSTILSTVWLLIAIIRPHWGSFVAMNGGSLSPRLASVLVAGFAKTIEMSFSTVMIACVGQYLTNKAKQSGISLIDLQVKSMILLPMALVTQKGGVRALLRSGVLGFICILAYTAAALYTTASDAVVSPRIGVSLPTTTNLSAFIQTSVANTYHIGQSCPNPPSSVQNDETCITTEHAGVSLRDYLQYLSNWKIATSQHQVVTESNKPVPMASYGDSVAVQGQWLYPVDYTAISKANGRLVTGTQMAMPFAGVINATTIPENNLDISSQLGGQLSVNAKAVTPVIGVTCAVVTPEELVPIVYSNWTTHTANATLTPTQFEGTYKDQTWRTNATAFDTLFGFNNLTRHRPVFYNLPAQYNSEFDGEGTYRDMLYILFNSNVSKSTAVEESQYTLCGMNFTLIGGCSSVYAANSSGTSLTLDCGKNNDMAFPMDPIKVVSTSSDWVNVAAVWGRSISLGSGILSSNAATVALLTQLAPTDSSFNPIEPSLADSLAILSAGTALESTIDAPFDGHWPFKTPPEQHNILPNAVIQKFQAKVQISDYSSGTTGDWKNVFAAELFLVVCLNIAALTYITTIVFGRISVSRRSGFERIPPQTFQEDITELREVFTAAIHSPTVRIINTPRPGSGSGIRWKYQNGVFRPSRLANYGSTSESRL